MVDLRLDKMSEIANNILMSESTALLFKSIGVIIAGLLVSSGRLPAEQSDAFANNIQLIGGLLLSGLGGFYLLEHAFQSAMAELKWNYKPDELPVKTVTTVTPATPVEPTKTVTTVIPIIPVETSTPPTQPTA